MNNFTIRRTYQVLFFPKRRIIFGIFFFFLSQPLLAQVNVVFDAFPQDIQLIQRDDADKAIVQISGKVYTENQTDISVLVYKNKKVFSYKKQKLQFTSTNQQISAAFSFSPIIDAELSEYDFKCYTFRNNDSLLVKEANEIVCGDNIIVYGQSNALANPSEDIDRFRGDNKFGRSTYANFDKNDYLWVRTQQWNYWSAGLIGLEIQKQLIDKFKIPIGIINGSEGNKSIEELSIRDEKSHDNPSTYYGRLLKRAKVFGLDKNVRMIVWRQGESEALDPNYKDDYDKKFDKFRKQLYEDFPSLRKIYTFQNNIYFGNNRIAGKLRDYQRTINNIYPDCEVMSTFGTTTFDGLHYRLEGYQQNGEDISRQIARDFYQSKDTLEVDAPNIQSIYFTIKKDSLILEFDKNQKMLFPKDEPKKDISHPSINIKHYIYFDDKQAEIENGSGNDNYIILKLKAPSDAKKISYTPDNYTFDYIAVLPGLTQIKNSRGVKALTFKNFPVNTIDNLKISSLTGKWDSITNRQIILNWKSASSKYLSYTYLIEKAQTAPNEFSEIGSTNGLSFYDTKIKKGVKYFYRIRITDSEKYSIYSDIIEVYEIDTNPITGISNEDFFLFPNPIAKGEVLNIEPLFDTPIKLMQITDSRGIRIQSFNESTTIQTSQLSAGIYFIEVILEDNTKLIKKFVVQ